jgi:ABC-type multidrug transport system fused ATPase/permease subunit
LGSIRLYQDTVASLLNSLRTLSQRASRAFQMIFHITAHTEAIQLADNPHLCRPVAQRNVELLDFDHYRLEGGMQVVATDLRFRYPNAKKDILHGINLTLNPGTTHAIVGLNGSAVRYSSRP